jgi:stress response protein SCP2
LSEVSDVVDYKKISLSLNEDETLVKYLATCGEGCDYDSSRYSARILSDSFDLDIFSISEKEKEHVNSYINQYGKTTQEPSKITLDVNKKVRTINISFSDFK